MKLFDTLKQFKNIEPDAGVAQRSRTQILLSPQHAKKTMSGVFIFLRVVETGAAITLAGFFILVVTGSFPATRPIAPIQYAVIDPAGLHAEAQAISMQIQLADVNYPQVTSTLESAAAVPTPDALKAAFSKAVASQATSTSSSTAATATSTASSSISIDQALQKLSH